MLCRKFSYCVSLCKTFFFCFRSVEGDYPPDATIKANKFVLRDFVLGTTNAIYAHVCTDGSDVKVCCFVLFSYWLPS